MKIRAFLLACLVFGGAFVMVQSYNEEKETEFAEFLSFYDSPFQSVSFFESSSIQTGVITNKEEVQSLLEFLKNYHIRKLDARDIVLDDDIFQYEIELKNDKGESMTLLISENIIIQNSSLYYEIVGGPVDTDWLVQYIASNK